MLVLTRKRGEKVIIPATGISVIVLEVGGGRVRLGFEAPERVTIVRAELASQPGGSGQERDQKEGER